MYQGVAQADHLVPGGTAVVMAEIVQFGEGLPGLAGDHLAQRFQALLGTADTGPSQPLAITGPKLAPGADNGMGQGRGVSLLKILPI